MKRMFRLFGLLAASALLAGCGGPGGGEHRGRFQLTVQWPERDDRLIPAASNSIRAVLTRGTETLGTQLLPRPATGSETSVTFENLPPGAVTLTATAFPQANGTGVAQATGSVDATIVAGQTAQAVVTMNSTIQRVEITPATPSVPAGGTVQLTMTAFNALTGGAVVLTSPGKVQWVSGTTANATINASGLVNGVLTGTSQITVTETESGKSANTTVTVTSTGGTGRIVFVNPGLHQVMGMDDTTGANLTGFGAAGTGTNQFGNPLDLAFDGAGRVYIADATTPRIVRMDDLSGTNWTPFGRRGSGVGEFQSPEGVAIDGAGRIYVTDRLNHRIVRMDDMTGANWTTFGTQGSGVGQFANPREISFDGAGRIYVADWFNHRIVRFDDMNGANWTSFGTFGTGVGNLNNPQAVFVATDGRIYIADRDNNRVVRIDDMQGTNWTTYGSRSLFNRLSGVFVAGNGRLYILDCFNDRIIRVDDMTGANRKTFPVPFSAVYPPTGILVR